MEQIISIIIFFECRGEPNIGQHAVASVIYNELVTTGELSIQRYAPWWAVRAKGKDTTIETWAAHALEIIKQVSVEPVEAAAWEKSKEWGKRVVSGQFKPIGPWTHFYSINGVAPAWALDGKDIQKIGNHIFLRLE